MENEKTTPAEEKDKDKKPEAEKPAEEAAATEETKAETAAEKPSEAPAEQTEETAPEAEETAPAAESESSESAPEAAPDYKAENDELRAENARLKAQLEAHNAGFKGEYIEDAVLIAENAAKRDGTTIVEALQAVAKKYPEWKHTTDEKGKSGFKVGADTPKEDKAAEDESLDEAFGIRRQK